MPACSEEIHGRRSWNGAGKLFIVVAERRPLPPGAAKGGGTIQALFSSLPEEPWGALP